MHPIKPSKNSGTKLSIGAGISGIEAIILIIIVILLALFALI